MKPSSVVTHHAQHRARERWGVELSIDEIERQIASGEAQVYKRENPRIWGLLLRTPEGFVPIIYNVGLKTVLTVLPKSELANIREEYGRGFASKEESAAFFASLDRKRLKEVEQHRDRCDLLDPLYNIANVRRAHVVMEFVDSLPADLRHIVHEHGYQIVRAFWDHGIRDATAVAILIEASRRATHAASSGLAALYSHFGAKSDYSAHYLATVARLEPSPKAPQEGTARLEKPKNRRRNALSR